MGATLLARRHRQRLDGDAAAGGSTRLPTPVRAFDSHPYHAAAVQVRVVGSGHYGDRGALGHIDSIQDERGAPFILFTSEFSSEEYDEGCTKTYFLDQNIIL